MARRFKIRHILDGSIITQDKLLRQWKFGFYIVFLMFLLIANNYYSEKIIRETNIVKRELKELQTEHLSTLSEYLKKSQQSEIAKRLDSIGIKESVVPPKKINN